MAGLATRQVARLTEHDTALRSALADDPTLRDRLTAVLDASEALGDYLAANPGEWTALRDPGRTLAAVETVADLSRGYRRQLLRICADDLTGGIDVAEVSDQLSALADATLGAALDMAQRELPPGEGDRMAVIAMGKCGAEELNYVSDVDVMFVAEGDLGRAERWAHEVMRICAQVAWPVDAGLRPEGRNGTVLRTIDSYLAYYRKWAHTWEFQALIKARPAAGDAELGDRWQTAVEPLIWEAVDRPEAVDEIRTMRRRVTAQLPRDTGDREIKLGSGGLRDIEFAVQLMQLVHGRGDESLRVRATLEALSALVAGGYLGRADGDMLSDTYRFLRVVEHRLQLQKLRRTHLIPGDGDALHWLARVLGFRDAEEFLAKWRRHAATVRRLHEKLFYRPLLESVAHVPTEALRLTPQAARSRLTALGFADPDGALHHITALTSGISRTAAIQRTLLPVLLGEFAAAPQPDRGLLAYRQVSDKLGSTPWYLRLLRDGGPVAVRLAGLLVGSRYMADLLLRDPAALRLLAEDSDLVPRDRAALDEGLTAAAARHDDPSAAIAAIRAIRRHELLRIACADLLGRLDVTEVGAALSDLTDAVLHAGLGVAASTVDEPVRMAVIGAGRLGGRETSYGSDADVLFVYDGDTGKAAAEQVASALGRLLSAPSPDPPLRLDADLRPEGRGGDLAPSLAAYQRYYAGRARLWEAQALLRARFSAGDAELAGQFLELADRYRYPRDGLRAEQVVELRRMKARVDAERLPRGADPATHTKLGRGGLADVEWAVQLLQLRHGADVDGLRTTSTLVALAAAAEAGLIGGSDADALAESWRMVSRVRNAITLSRGTPGDQLPRTGPELANVARIIGGFDPEHPGDFLDIYLRITRRGHAAADRAFYT